MSVLNLPFAIYRPEGEKISLSDYVERGIVHSGNQRLHSHMQTCHKGFLGQTGCRLCKPSGECLGTHPVLLTARAELEEGDDVPAGTEPEEGDPRINVQGSSVEKSYVVSNFEREENPVHTLLDPCRLTLKTSVGVWEVDCPPVPNILHLEETSDFSRDEILNLFQPLYDDREFKEWEEFWSWINGLSDEDLKTFHEKISVQLPKGNGRVACFSPIISRMTGSHNNVLILGSTVQAAAAVFYVAPYMGKSKVPLLESLIVLNDVVRNLHKYPSTAEDAGSETRTVKLVLQRTLNQLHLKMELSSYQVAAKLLSLPTFSGTVQHSYLNPVAEMCAAAIWKLDRMGAAKRLQYSENPPVASKQDEAESDDEDLDLPDLVPKLGHAESDDEDEDLKDFIVDDSDMRDIEPEEESQKVENKMEEKLSPEERHLLDVLDGDVGKFKLFHIEEDPTKDGYRKEFVALSSIYNNRGKALRHLSRYEMSALIELVEKKKDGKERPNAFPVAPGFSLAANHEFVLRRKQHTPVLTRNPPRHPGDKPTDAKALQNWHKAANVFADYVLINFRPEEDFYSTFEQQNLHSYTFEQLESWIDSLQRDDNMISKFRLVLLNRHIYGLRTSHVVKKMCNEFRGRSRDLWEKGDQKDSWKPWTREDLNEMNSDGSEFIVSSGEVVPRIQKSVFLKRETRSYRHLTESSTGSLQQESEDLQEETETEKPETQQYTKNQRRNPTFNMHGESMRPYIDECQALADTLRSFSAEVNPTGGVTGEQQTPLEFDIRTARTSKELNPKQRELFETALGLMTGDSEVAAQLDPPIVLVTGPPGTGKSEVIKQTSLQAEKMHKRVFRITFNNLNALHVGGVTLASVIKHLTSGRQKEGNKRMPPFSQRLPVYSVEDLDHFRKVTGVGSRDTCPHMFIFDESSNLAGWYIAAFSCLCQQALGNDLPFGGIPIIFVGDHRQMKPVKAGDSLTKSVLQVALHNNADILQTYLHNRRDEEPPDKKRRLDPGSKKQELFKSDHPYNVGATLFSSAKWFELTDQCRASEDSVQSEFVQRAYQGNSFDPDEIFSFPHLTKEDLQQEQWLRAPMIVALNHERSILTHERSITYAKFTGNLVVRWPARFTPLKGRTSALEQVPDHCAYYEYFVAGMDGFFTDSFSKPLGLVNALPVVYDSLVVSNLADHELIQAALADDNRFLVTLSEPPALINVKLPQEAVDTIPKEAKRYLKEISLENKEIVIPVSPKCSKEPLEIMDIDNPLDSRNDTRVSPWFPLELGFAITCEKSEGRTLDFAILALSKRTFHNFTWEALNVATSRVKRRSNMRIFLIGDTEREKRESIAYIANLRPCPSVESFFHGYQVSKDMPWTQRKFNARAAAIHYVHHSSAFATNRKKSKQIRILSSL